MSRATTTQELSMRTSIPAILPTRHDVPNITCQLPSRMPSLVLSADERQQQQEHVEDVEEDRGGEQRGGPDVLAAAKALEVEGRQAGEDHQAKDRIDHRAVGDLNKDRDDAEQDQPDQSPEEGAGKPRQVAPGRVAGGPEPGDEQRRR